jgi:hypothetical protein
MEKPSISELIEFCVERFKTYNIFTGDDGKFYESDEIGCSYIPVNHVRCLLSKELNENFEIQPRVRRAVIDKVIEAIFKWAKKSAEKMRESNGSDS